MLCECGGKAVLKAISNGDTFEFLFSFFFSINVEIPNKAVKYTPVDICYDGTWHTHTHKTKWVHTTYTYVCIQPTYSSYRNRFYAGKTISYNLICSKAKRIKDQKAIKFLNNKSTGYNFL